MQLYCSDLDHQFWKHVVRTEGLDALDLIDGIIGCVDYRSEYAEWNRQRAEEQNIDAARKELKR
jgi:hypothetical protein